MAEYIVILTPHPDVHVEDARLERVEVEGDRYEGRGDRTIFLKESATGPPPVTAEFRTSHVVGIVRQ